MKTNKVWVIQDRGGMDFTPAKKFGEICTLYDGTISSFNIKALYEFAVEHFKKEAGENDWLILTGHVSAIAAASIAYQKLFGRLSVLIYRANTREYVEREVYTNGERNESTSSKSDRERA